VRMAAVQDWQGLTQLDRSLSQIALTAPWGMQAAQLRVEWRVRVANPELRERYGNEALAIIDQVLPQQPTSIWCALRALSAVGTGRPEIELESIAGFTRAAEGGLSQQDPGERRALLERARTLTQLMDALAADEHLDRGRVATVRDGLNALVARLR